MISNKYQLPIAIGCVLALNVTLVDAYQYSFTDVTDFGGWSDAVNNGQITLHQSGANGFTRVQTDSTADAFYGVAKVTAFNCPTFCMVRISRFIGTYMGNDLRAEIRLQSSAGEKIVHYRLRTYDPVTFDQVETLASGDIGNRSAGWSLNENVGIAVGVKGNEVVFYGSNQNSLQKVEFFGGFIPYHPPGTYRIEAWTESAADSITATFSNFIDVGLTP